MTDQAIPADLSPADVAAAREWAKTIAAANRVAYTDPARAAARVVLATVPAPPRPTLADMTPAERRACRRMQADVEGRSMRYVIANPHDKDGEVTLLDSDGGVDWVFPEYVTPRPDLPQWEYPGTEKPDPAPAPAPALPDGWRLADHKDHGRVIVTNPNQESDGYSYCIFSSDMDSAGFDWYPCAPDALTYIDQEADTHTGPNTLAVGTVIESADDPRPAALPDGSILLDRDGKPVIKAREVWNGPGLTPVPPEGDTFGPWTVLHIPKEADQ